MMRFIALGIALMLFAAWPDHLTASDAGSSKAAVSSTADTLDRPASRDDLKSPNLKASIRKDGQPGELGDKPNGLQSLVTVLGALAVVLGVFFFVAWLLRKTSPHGAVVLPTEVFEMLGRAPLANRQQAQLLRCGNKLLLISVTPTHAETLTEITNPEEVDRLTKLCRQNRSQTAAATFRRVLERTIVKGTSYATASDKDFGNVDSPISPTAEQSGERKQGHE
jgi:flagellar biogenesis protein FliO